MGNIYITGANGFLGANLVKHFLGTGYEVIAVIRADGARDNLTNFGCQIIEYDGSISSLQANLNANTTVIHTASYYVAEHNKEDIAVLINSNLQYGLNLLEAMRICGTNKIINIGTAWQGYEAQERRPVNLYAATKQAFEDFVAYYCDAENFSAISLRLNDTYGEKDERLKLIKLLINAGIENISLDMSAGDQYINLTHVHDVCKAIDFAVQKMPSCNKINRYNLLSNDELTLKELVKTIEKVLDIVIPVNWGAKEYRRREVMVPIKSNRFPSINFEKNLLSGIKMIYREMISK